MRFVTVKNCMAIQVNRIFNMSMNLGNEGFQIGGGLIELENSDLRKLKNSKCVP